MRERHLILLDAENMERQYKAMSRTRMERLQMADSRAMEEQRERENPVQPLKNGTRRGRTTLVADAPEYVGGGATPSMGLSQIRGGRVRKMKERSPSPSEDLTGGAIIGAGTKKGQTRKTARKAYEPKAHEMGKALSEHIHSLHGAGFWDDFKSGFMSVARPLAGVASMLPGPAGMVGKVASSLMGGGNVSGPGYEAVSGGVRTGAYEGKGKLLIQHLPHGEGEELVVGKGKKTRRPAGPDDARRKRGQMVSRLMKEKGMTLAEASRHIKAHGLM